MPSAFQMFIRIREPRDNKSSLDYSHRSNSLDSHTLRGQYREKNNKNDKQ